MGLDLTVSTLPVLILKHESLILTAGEFHDSGVMVFADMSSAALSREKMQERMSIFFMSFSFSGGGIM